MAVNPSLNDYPFVGMIRYSAPGLIGADHVKPCDGYTIVDPQDYPLVTQVLDPTVPGVKATAYNETLGIYAAADSGADDQPLAFWWSTNGINWNLGTKFPANASTSIYSIAAVSTGFVAVGNNTDSDKAVIYTSADGKTWTLAQQGATNSLLYDVAEGNDLIIAVGTDGTNALNYVSDDGGATWAVGNLTSASTAARCIAYSDTLTLFAVGQENGKIATSADDAVWAEHTTDTAVKTTSILWNGTAARFVAAADDDKIYTSDAAGTTYTGAAADTGMAYIIFVGGLYVGIDAATQSDIYTSTNKTAWTLRYNGALAFGSKPSYSVALDLFIASVIDGDHTIQLVTSSDGLTWAAVGSDIGIQAYQMPTITLASKTVYMQLK